MSASIESEERPPRETVGDRCPAAAAAVFGAVCIAFSAPLVALSGADAGTASFYRCVIALPVLGALAIFEQRTRGRREEPRLRTRMSRSRFWTAPAAGVLLGGDLLLWSQSVDEVGAGVSTVIVNLQVLLVPLIALVVDREALSRRFALAVVPMLGGVALAGGVGSSGTGSAPVAGTIHAALAAVCYAGYLFLLRRGAADGTLVRPVLHVTFTAGVTALVAGALWQGIDVAPGWTSFGWLVALALSGQVLGWLAIAVALPRLATRTGASLLLLQPVGAVLIAFVVLHQQPTGLQLIGSVLVVAAVLVVSWHSSNDNDRDNDRKDTS